MDTNPKLVGSNLIECIPQTGKCPNKCPECFYNGAFYRPLDTPLIPTKKEAIFKLVRVNSGHDSNIQRELVIRKTKDFPNKFYNTSIPKFDFPGPVVFTCNGHKLILVDSPPPNIMFVRFRLATNNLEEADEAVKYYWVKHQIPVVMTFMRYYNKENVPDLKKYKLNKHILNHCYVLKPEFMIEIMSRWNKMNPPILGVRMCGTPYSSFCADCRNCEFLYVDHMNRRCFALMLRIESLIS
ncbi:MAG: hypothetical protein PHE59_04515 [Patescibacteria group bacterium]|nr:hypothetical protein [Patescibacteria group bacterium]MDD5164427.1 hypothetical protein [Patescibacteria group bacterium]MDD5534596.1 hypothetical protein [Patescibacteria group bacterium]